MVELEDGVATLEDTSQAGLENLVMAFPDEDGAFDLCGYSSGRICIFLSLLRSGTTLPARHQVVGILRQMAAHVAAGRTVFPMEPAASERAALRRLADVLVEVVVDGIPKGFRLVEGYHENGTTGICVSQGFCDLTLGRWEEWSAGSDESEASLAAAKESELDSPTLPREAPPQSRALETIRLQLQHLAESWLPRRPPQRRLGEPQPAAPG